MRIIHKMIFPEFLIQNLWVHIIHKYMLYYVNGKFVTPMFTLIGVFLSVPLACTPNQVSTGIGFYGHRTLMVGFGICQLQRK